MPAGWSRRLDDLLTPAESACRAWLAGCEARGVTVLVYNTWRSPEAQEAVYAQGRTFPGKNWAGMAGYGPGYYATMARPWESWHQYRVAWDAVPMVSGQPDWTYADKNRDGVPDEDWWRIMVEQADLVGIEWAGRWNTFREYVHWQFTMGLDRVSLRHQAELFEKLKAGQTV